MATLGAKFYDLIDAFKDNAFEEIAAVIELLAETNEILDDAITLECNEGTKHKTTVRTGLPSVAWGQLYKGIPQSKSTKAQVVDSTGFCEGLSTIDKRLLDLAAGNRGAVRLSEARGFLESLSQEMADTIIYGDVTNDPEKFTGLHARFSAISGAANGGQIVDGSGSGSDNTSIWFVTWGDDACHLLYPKGTPAGVSRTDMGVQRVLDGDSNPYYAEEEMFSWHCGVTVRDWRKVVRVANIDVSDLQAGSVDIYALLRKGFWKLRKHMKGPNATVYCNSDVMEALDADSTPTASTNVSTNSPVRLRPMEIQGKEVMSYRGFPVRQVDAILNTESQIT